jgi:hypothetical protein
MQSLNSVTFVYLKITVVIFSYTIIAPILVAARSKAWFCGRSLAGIAGSNSPGVHGCLYGVFVVCCQIEVSAFGRSLVQKIPTECVRM